MDAAGRALTLRVFAQSAMRPAPPGPPVSVEPWNPSRSPPTIWQFPFAVGHVHAVRLPDGYALIDTGVPGSARRSRMGLDQLGARPHDVRQIVLTHSHVDHMGSAADLVAVTGARVLAGVLDTPFICGAARARAGVHCLGTRPL